MKEVPGRILKVWSSSMTWAPLSVSRFPVGSSASTRIGSTTSARAIATDIEGWNLKIERTVNTLILRSATMTTEVLSIDAYDEISSPFFLKIGWTIEMR